MIGFILAAGFGTRLRPLTDHIPKALITVCGEPLLKRALDFFQAGGIKNIAVNSHHLADQIESFRKASDCDFRIFHETQAIRGTGGAFYFAREFLGSDDCFVVANVDIVAQIDMRRLRELFLRLQCVAALVTVPSSSGTVLYHAGSQEYAGARSEKSSIPEAAGAALMSADYIGIAFYRKEILDCITAQDFSILPVWKRAQEKGMAVKVMDAGPVYWNDAGNAKNLAQIHFDVLDRTCSISVPAYIKIDTKDKKAYPSSFTGASAAALGPYSWVETASMPRNAAGGSVVVFKDAVFPDSVTLVDCLVTRYGVIPFAS